jgi:hypothetical protein
LIADDDGRRGTAGGADFFRQFLQQVFAPRRDRQAHPLGGQRLGDAPPDARTGAGDDGRLAVELQIHEFLSVLVVARHRVWPVPACEPVARISPEPHAFDSTPETA